MTCICACRPQKNRSAEEKRLFLGSDAQCDRKHCGIVGGDLNGHVGTNVDG